MAGNRNSPEDLDSRKLNMHEQWRQSWNTYANLLSSQMTHCVVSDKFRSHWLQPKS
jgi:hypothetical protein